MKKYLSLLVILVCISFQAFSQETLQTVTERGNSTNRNISVMGTGNNYFRGFTTVDSSWSFNRVVFGDGFSTNGISQKTDLQPFYFRKPNGNMAYQLRIYGLTTSQSSLVNSAVFYTDTIVFNSNTLGTGYNQWQFRPVITQTGYSGITRGVYVNPSLTDVENFRAVETNVGSGKGYQIYAAGAAASYFAGYVGLGVTVPAYRLHIEGITKSNAFIASNSEAIRLINNRSYISAFDSSNTTRLGYLQFNSADSQIALVAEGNARLRLSTGGTSRIHILSNGNVGVGTSTPTEKLHINGNVFISGAFYWGWSGRGISVIVPKEDTNGRVLRFSNSMNAAQANPYGGFDFTNPNGESVMRILNGKVGIGTVDPQSELAVKGTITAMRIKVINTGWADYVFDSSYQLAPLSQVEKFISENKHLPDVPSAAEVKRDGIDLGNNQAVLLKKIEELTLYIIQMEKRIAELEGDKQKNAANKF